MLAPDLVRSVLDSAPDAMIVIDSSGTILFANHQVAALFGYSIDQILGRPVEALLPERFRVRHLGHRRRYAESGKVRPMGAGLELFALRADDTEFPVEISLSPIESNGRFLTAAAIRDVSERKRVEQVIREARAEADRANLAKSRFLATASHDLRQPLQSLALLSGTLRRLVPEGEAHELLLLQDQAMGAMSRLLNALLDISKLESGAIKPDISDFRVAALLEELRAEFAGIAATKGLKLDIEASQETVRSDPSLVGQILRNLLANAIKYTERGVVLLGCCRDADIVRISVRDSGVGISREQLAYIYDEFYQCAPRADRSREGYGLGLSIVQRLVRLLDLRIEVQSQVGVGSTFSLALPGGSLASAHEPAARAGIRAAPRQSTARHVLVVEDDPGVRNATRVFLKGEGFRVTTAASLEEATQRARETRDFDLIVSDYHLGSGATGTEVIAEVRRTLGRPMRAVLVTGDTSSAMRELQKDALLRVTSKPINADELLGLMRELLAAPEPTT